VLPLHQPSEGGLSRYVDGERGLEGFTLFLDMRREGRLIVLEGKEPLSTLSTWGTQAPKFLLFFRRAGERGILNEKKEINSARPSLSYEKIRCNRERGGVAGRERFALSTLLAQEKEFRLSYSYRTTKGKRKLR